jgi:hypothetical protein
VSSRSPLYRSNLVALSYALLCAMYLAMLAVLASAIWAGSFARLWRDVGVASDSFTTLGTLAVSDDLRLGHVCIDHAGGNVVAGRD